MHLVKAVVVGAAAILPFASIPVIDDSELGFWDFLLRKLKRIYQYTEPGMERTVKRQLPPSTGTVTVPRSKAY